MRYFNNNSWIVFKQKDKNSCDFGLDLVLVLCDTIYSVKVFWTKLICVPLSLSLFLSLAGWQRLFSDLNFVQEEEEESARLYFNLGSDEWWVLYYHHYYESENIRSSLSKSRFILARERYI